MQELLRAWDGEFVAMRHDAPTGATIWIAVHRSRPTGAVGGTRLRHYETPQAALRDALRLAEGMSLKLAALDLPRGGGKAVLDAPEGIEGPAHDGLIDRYADLLDSLGGVYATGPDLGTTPRDMDRIAARSRHVFGTSPERGGAGDPGPATALGVLCGIRAAVEHRHGSADLRGRRVLVQGLGDVGRPLAAMLAAAGAEVSFTDVDPAARRRGEEAGHRWVKPDLAPAAECDVFAPCAVGGVASAATIPRLRCAIVAGSANNVLATAGDAERLRERGILYAPDFVINGGGAILLLGAEALGWSRPAIDERIRAIGPTLRDVFRRADEEGITTQEAALRLARRRLGDAVRVGGV
jgi:leucine dehydrogenase